MVKLTDSRYDGDVYEPERDNIRLGNQLWAIWKVMKSGRWYSLAEIENMTGHPQASISAQLRHLRKDRFGSHDIYKRRRNDSNQWEYCLQPNPDVEVEL